MIVNKDALYAKTHEWLIDDGDSVRIGISDYAQSELGDLVFVNLPEAMKSLSVKLLLTLSPLRLFQTSIHL